MQYSYSGAEDKGANTPKTKGRFHHALSSKQWTWGHCPAAPGTEQTSPTARYGRCKELLLLILILCCHNRFLLLHKHAWHFQQRREDVLRVSRSLPAPRGCRYQHRGSPKLQYSFAFFTIFSSCFSSLFFVLKHSTLEKRTDEDVKNYIYICIYDSYLFTMQLGPTAEHPSRLHGQAAQGWARS